MRVRQYVCVTASAPCVHLDLQSKKGNTGPRAAQDGGAATRFRNCAGILRASGSRISMMSMSRRWSSLSRPSCFATSLLISPISSRRLRNHLAICSSSSSDCTKDAYPLQSHLGAPGFGASARVSITSPIARCSPRKIRKHLSPGYRYCQRTYRGRLRARLPRHDSFDHFGDR